MTQDQAIIIAILAATVAMFLWGRWRHDMVALGSLLACVFTGLVPTDDAFAGFGHPAVITVACVLVLSRGLQTSGAVDLLTQRLLPHTTGPRTAIAALTGLAAVLSAFMNNIGALALLMPVAIQVAARQALPPGLVLMPVAFGSILGGMTTLIGTPPNLIVSGFRAQAGPGTFAMFDFTPVGLTVAAAGVVFVAVFGRWLIPSRQRTDVEGFETGAYLTEARVPDKGKASGMTLREVEQILEESGAQVVGLVRNEVRLSAPSQFRRVRPHDILVIEAEPEGLATALSNLGLELEEAVQEPPAEEDAEDEAEDKADDAADDAAEDAAKEAQKARQTAKSKVARADTMRAAKTGGRLRKGRDEADKDGAEAADEVRTVAQSDEIVLTEFVVLPDSSLVGRSATDIRLRTRFSSNLLAVSRQGRRSVARLRRMPIYAGDVLLMQGSPEALAEFAAQFACVPLAERQLRLPDRRRAFTATAVMAGGVAGAAFGLMPAAISFAAGVLAAMALRVVPPRTVYNAIDWPVIVLLAALIPVAGAMASTGAADLIATALLNNVARGHATVALVIILIAAMTLSDFMNNAATAAVMCPIAIGTALHLDVSPDPFLMAVAVGASCAFLTPIGHQNSTLILGPGGFRFGDYWRLGLPLEVIVIAVGVPMILWVWPLSPLT